MSEHVELGPTDEENCGCKVPRECSCDCHGWDAIHIRHLETLGDQFNPRDVSILGGDPSL